MLVSSPPITKNLIIFDILPHNSVYFNNSNYKKEIDDLNLNVSGLKKYDVNFSTNDEKDVLTKLKDSSSKKRVLFRYFFETDTQNYKGSIFIDTEEKLIVHYYPSFFSKDIRENILSFFMLFIKKASNKKHIFEVYNEHTSQSELIRYKQDEDTSLPGKDYVKTLMGNINNKLRGSFLGRNELFTSVLKTYYTTDQQVLARNLLLNRIRYENALRLRNSGLIPVVVRS